MFRRIRCAIDVFRDKPSRWHPDGGETTTVPSSREIEDTREIMEERKRVNNPAISLIEAVATVWLSAYVIYPAIRIMFTPSPKSQRLLVGITSVLMYQFWHFLQNTISEQMRPAIRLDFLDPYFGRRLKRTISILKG